jgi:hypothetical protein
MFSVPGREKKRENEKERGMCGGSRARGDGDAGMNQRSDAFWIESVEEESEMR